jgi:hypothetical protein
MLLRDGAVIAEAVRVVRRTLARALYEVMTLGSRFPVIALPAARLRSHGVVVDAGTDLVVEGYPRSGNSFAVAGIATAQTRPVRIAHHLHAPGHVLASARLKVPTLVVVREPGQAAVELCLSKRALTMAQALRGYRRFYAPLLPHRASFAVATFDQVTGGLGRVIERVNHRFGTTFEPFADSEEAVAEAHRAIDEHWSGRSGPGLPLLGRTREASTPDVQETRRGILRAAYADPLLARSRGRAERLYTAFERLSRVG